MSAPQGMLGSLTAGSLGEKRKKMIITRIRKNTRFSSYISYFIVQHGLMIKSGNPVDILSENGLVQWIECVTCAVIIIHV